MLIVTSLADIAARADLARADAVLTPAVYRLGCGGFNPDVAHPWNSKLECDCSGFAAWCLGLPRHLVAMPGAGEWIETSAIYADATGAQEIFKQTSAALPGCLIVWPDRKANGHTKQGHVGVIVDVSPDLLGVTQPIGVVHCSKGNERVHGNAIYRTGPEIFYKYAAVVCALRLPAIP